MKFKLVRNEDGSYSMVEDTGPAHGYRAGQRAITPTDLSIYGEAGLFAPCTRDQFINASIQGVGVERWLFWRGTTEEINSAGILTHVGRNPNLENDYDPPSTVCGACETGTFTFCEFQWRLGEYCVNTLPRNVKAQGKRMCDRIPRYRVYGDVRDATGKVIYPSGSVIERDDEWGLVVAAAQLSQIFQSQIWTGSGLLVGAHREMLGLTAQVNTGWEDRLGDDCPGADPWVKPFNGSIGDTYGGVSICELVGAGVRNSVWRAQNAQLGVLGSEDLAIFTYPDVADSLVLQWECCMAQTCQPATTATSVQVRINAEEQLALRRRQGFIDGLYRAGSINVQGLIIGVYGDLGVPHTTNLAGTTVTADIYGLVRRVGGLQTIGGEYQDYSKTMPPRLATERNAHYGYTDMGRYAIAFNHEGYCYEEQISLSPMVMVWAPFLQFRITGVTANVISALPTPADVYGGRAVPATLAISGGPS